MGALARLEELGVELPSVAAPLASYIPAIQVGEPAKIRKIVIKVALDTCL